MDKKVSPVNQRILCTEVSWPTVEVMLSDGAAVYTTFNLLR